jgi:hypothetical protein
MCILILRMQASISGKHPPGYVLPFARDRIPIHNQEMTQYFINVTVSTPPL